MRLIVFIFSINWINQYYWYIKTLTAFFCPDFFLAFRYSLLCTSSLLNSFLLTLLTFSQISLYFSKNFLLKNIYTQFRQNLSYIYSFLGGVCIKAYFFSTFVTYEIFKILFTKRKLISYYYFINIYIVYWNRAFMLMMKFIFFNFSIAKLYNFFIYFYI